MQEKNLTNFNKPFVIIKKKNPLRKLGIKETLQLEDRASTKPLQLTLYLKTEWFTPTFRNKAKKSAFSTLKQHCVGVSSQCYKARKGNK